MADISITQTPSGFVGPDAKVTLAVAVSPNPSQYTYSWVLADGSTAAGTTIEVTGSARAGGRYQVTATPKRPGGDTLSAGHTLQVAGQSPPTTPPPPDKPEPPLIFDPWFASGAAIVIGLLAILLLAPLVYRLYNTDSRDAVDRMAIITSLGLLSIGAVVLLLGVYGALLEVRGRMRTRKEQEALAKVQAGVGVGAEETFSGIALIIDAIGKLRGAALILVVGCVPLVAAAWVAQSGVDNGPDSTATPTARPATRTPSPVPTTPSTGTTTPTP